MSGLYNSLSIAGTGLAAVNAQLALVSQNVANAGSTGYVTEQLSQTSLSSGGQADGVLTGVATRVLNTQLQQDLFAQNGTVSALSTTQTALQPIDAAQGTVGGNNDLSSQLANLQTAFTALENDPSSTVQQSQVVAAAGQLAGSINTLGQAYTTARQNVQDTLVTNVATLNTTLKTIGALSDQIVTARVDGLSTAGLEDQRDAALQTVSSLVGIKYLQQPNGDMVVLTTGGLTLPIHGSDTVSLASETLGPDSASELGDVPGIMIGGQDVTAQMTGGSIGAGVTLRDSTLPTYMAELDQFAQSLSSGFAQQGLTLFTDANGNVPAGGGTPVQSGYVGYALSIQVNPAVQATPSLVRDGTTSIAGSPTGASAFTPNTDPAQTSFATDVQSGVPQPAIPTTGLGPAGDLAAPYAAPTSLGDAASALVGAQSQDIANTTTQLTNEQAVQTTLQTQFSATSAVDTDTQLATMVQLQQSYAANAKIFTTIQTMFTDMLAMVTA
jgi:flagellar hook-associated protein 1 FlgK